MATEQQVIDLFHSTLTELDARMSAENQVGQVIARRTSRIIKTVLWLLAVVAAVVLYLIQDLAHDMVDMTGNMVSMYENFGEVSDNMGTITASVTRMNGNVRTLPNMTLRMSQMSRDMAAMNGDVDRMNATVTTMDTNVGVITGGVGAMSHRFDILTRSTQGMGYNVNQMSEPVRTFDPFGFFGR